MIMFNFDFIRPDRTTISTANGMFSDVEEAKRHCQTLLSGVGRATGATKINLRENGGLVIYTVPSDS